VSYRAERNVIIILFIWMYVVLNVGLIAADLVELTTVM
jgi:hypothetical protein